MGDDVVGVAVLFDQDGAPDGVAEITRAGALGSRLAFELALAATDPVLSANLIKETRSISEGDDLLVMQTALIVLLTSVVRPSLELLGDHASSLRETIRNCANEFDSLID